MLYKYYRKGYTESIIKRRDDVMAQIMGGTEVRLCHKQCKV